jgi:hypothetical protein
MTKITDTDRRRFCRVNDDIYLEYLVLKESEVETAIAEFNNQFRQHFNPINQLQAITARSENLLDQLRSSHPEITEYLSTIEERLQLLAHAIAQDQVGVPIVPNESVNISAGGLSFSSEQPLETGSLIEFSIIIAPSYLHISALGAVVYCRRDEANDPAYPYRIGAEFSHIHQSDRQALEQHIERKA